MKHISESIIGKWGNPTKAVPELQTHDIVRLANDHYYIVITDEDEMKQSKLSFIPRMIREGIFLKYESISRSWSWQPISEYEKSLRIKPQYKSITPLDVIAVYRSASAITTKYQDHFYMWCDEDNMKEKVLRGYGDYQLIWER